MHRAGDDGSLWRCGVSLEVGRTFLSGSNPRTGAFLPSERIRIDSGRQECPPLIDSRQARMPVPPRIMLSPQRKATPMMESPQGAGVVVGGVAGVAGDAGVAGVDGAAAWGAG